MEEVSGEFGRNHGRGTWDLWIGILGFLRLELVGRSNLKARRN